MSPGALPGFRDFYPAEFAERAHLFTVWRDVAQRFGFVEYDGPPLEALDLYTKKSGDEIVAQLYEFEDKGKRRVALRPEMTPTLARMVAERANALRKPVRWFSIPQLFRYERQQRGRLREHFQLNLDIIGEPDVTADAELLASAIEIMRALGLTSADVVARVSDRRLLEDLWTGWGGLKEQLPTVYRILDKAESDPPATHRKLLDAGLPDPASGQIARWARPLPFDQLAPLFETTTVTERVAPLRRYFTLLDALGVAEWVQFDLSIVRGLAYYTGIVFELFDAKGELRAICGGGRYDTLLSSLGGVDLPALGFGMGDVVLGELLRTRGLMPAAPSALDLWVAFAEDEAFPHALRIAARLRARGRRVEYALGGQKLARQLKAADAAGAPLALVVSLEGAQKGEAMLRDLRAGSEHRVSVETWIDSQ